MRLERRLRYVLLAGLLVSLGLCFVPGIQITNVVGSDDVRRETVRFVDFCLFQFTDGRAAGVPCAICLAGAVLALLVPWKALCMFARGVGSGLAFAAVMRAWTAARYLGGSAGSIWPLYGIVIAAGLCAVLYVPAFLWANRSHRPPSGGREEAL